MATFGSRKYLTKILSLSPVLYRFVFTSFLSIGLRYRVAERLEILGNLHRRYGRRSLDVLEGLPLEGRALAIVDEWAFVNRYGDSCRTDWRTHNREQNSIFLKTVFNSLKLDSVETLTDLGCDTEVLSRFSDLCESLTAAWNSVPDPFCLELLASKSFSVVSPFSGEKISHTRSLIIDTKWPGVFFRFECVQVFYILFGGIPGGEYHPTALYIPSSGAIVNLSGKPVDKILMSDVMSLRQILLPIDGRLKGELDVPLKAKLFFYTCYHFNIGHHLVNELGGLSSLEAKGLGGSVDFLGRGRYEYYGLLGDFIDQGELVDVFDSSSFSAMQKQALCGEYTIVSLRGNFISEAIANRLLKGCKERCSAEEIGLISLARSECDLLLWISFRLHNREWLDQEEGLVWIVNQLANEYDNMGVVFDGFTFPAAVEHWNEDEINEKNLSIREELEMVERVTKGINNCKVYSVIGCSMDYSIAFADMVDCFLGPIGAGLSKVSLICNKPGVQHGCSKLIDDYSTWYNLDHREGSVRPVTINKNMVQDIGEPSLYNSYRMEKNEVYKALSKVIEDVV